MNFSDIFSETKSIKVKMYATVRVPAFEFKFNLVVCPLPEGISDVSLFLIYLK